MARKILSILVGYAIFAATAVALFKFSGQDPHADPAKSFMVLTAIYGALFSFIAGILTKLIARTRDLTINYVLAVIMAGFATFSFFKSGGNHWTQLLAIFVFAPISILGGLFYSKRATRYGRS